MLEDENEFVEICDSGNCKSCCFVVFLKNVKKLWQIYLSCIKSNLKKIYSPCVCVCVCV